MKIQKDEKQDVEFKKNWRDEYLKWICAFSNTHGGVLYVGVMDDGEICGAKAPRNVKVKGVLVHVGKTCGYLDVKA